MNLETALAAGACRCGQIIFEVHASPIITSACHCRGCQKMAASGFSLSALFPAESLQVTRGTPVIGGLHGPTQHQFCSHCLSWLFTRPADNPTIISVRSSLLDQPQRYAPFIETWIREKLPWATTGATHSFERFPDPQDYGTLIAQFAARDQGAA